MAMQRTGTRNTGPSRSQKRKGRDSGDEDSGSTQKSGMVLCVFDYLCNQCHALMLTDDSIQRPHVRPTPTKRTKLAIPSGLRYDFKVGHNRTLSSGTIEELKGESSGHVGVMAPGGLDDEDALGERPAYASTTPDPTNVSCSSLRLFLLLLLILF